MAPNHKLTKRSVNMVLQSHVKHTNHYNSTTGVPRATNLDRMVAHIDELLLIKFHDTLIMIYLYHKSTYDKQTWLSNCRFDHVAAL